MLITAVKAATDFTQCVKSRLLSDSSSDIKNRGIMMTAEQGSHSSTAS